jgi:hypothetical protein
MRSVADEIRSIPGRIPPISGQLIGRAAVAASAVLLLAFVLGPLTTGSPGSSIEPSLPPAASAQVPLATDSPSPPPTEAPPSDPAEAALDDIRELTSDLRGGERNNFRKEIDEVSRALVDGDQDKARAEASDLSKRIDELVEKEQVDAETGDRLQEAARVLLEALGAGGDGDD